MVLATPPVKLLRPADGNLPPFVLHPSFLEPGADKVYNPRQVTETPRPSGTEHLADDDTRDYARRMHYAAYRWQKAAGGVRADYWKRQYHELRDRIIVGNRKLI